MAVTDGEHILGVNAGSTVNQGLNCSPIAVSDSRSQRTLYQQALASDEIEPKDITYVEAPGTGGYRLHLL